MSPVPCQTIVPASLIVQDLRHVREGSFNGISDSGEKFIALALLLRQRCVTVTFLQDAAPDTLLPEHFLPRFVGITFISKDLAFGSSQQVVEFVTVVDMSPGKLERVNDIGVTVNTNMAFVSVGGRIPPFGKRGVFVTVTFGGGLGLFQCRINNGPFADDQVLLGELFVEGLKQYAVHAQPGKQLTVAADACFVGDGVVARQIQEDLKAPSVCDFLLEPGI